MSSIVAGQGSVEIATRRARWASLAVLGSTVCGGVYLFSWGPHQATQPPAAVSLLSVCLNIATTFIYLRWLHRAVANTMLLRAPIKWAPRHAVTAYFIPVIGLFRPYQVMTALHAASDPSALPEAPVFRDRPAPNYREGVREPLPPVRWDHPAPIAAWWGVYNLCWVWAIGSANYAQPLSVDGTVALNLTAAVLCALVIRSVDTRQRERYRRLAASVSAPAAS